jgi:integrase
MVKITVAELTAHYLAWAKINRAAKTFNQAKTRIGLFTAQLTPKVKCDAIRPYHVTQVISQHPNWSKSSHRDFIGSIKRMFNWGYEQGYLDANPLQRLKPPAREQGEEFVTPEEFSSIIGLSPSREFRDIVTFAWETGIRPQEARLIEIGDLDAAEGIITIPKERAKGGKKARIIYLTPLALELAKASAIGKKSGPLFRSPRGHRWLPRNFHGHFRTLSRKTGKLFRFGHLRKGYATQALINGVDVITLSHLMGHTDTTMLAKHYAKVHKNTKHMAESALRAKGGANKL